ncbi:MAG: hypothetical protein ABEJ91_03605 [Candidatus Nanohaloarchaea archaeon]
MEAREKEILDTAEDYGLGGHDYLLDSDDEFIYFEISDAEGIDDAFFDLGRELNARSTASVNGGEEYRLSVRKN